MSFGVRVPRPGVVLVGCWTGCGCSAGDGEGAEPVQGVGGELGPGCFGGEVEQDVSAGAGEGGGDGEQSEPEPFRFPAAGVVVGAGRAAASRR